MCASSRCPEDRGGRRRARCCPRVGRRMGRLRAWGYRRHNHADEKSMRFMRWFSHPAGRADAQQDTPGIADPTRQGFEAWCPSPSELDRASARGILARAETRARLSTRERGGPDDPQARNTLRPDGGLRRPSRCSPRRQRFRTKTRGLPRNRRRVRRHVSRDQ